jgi:hypothetical protein
MNCNTIIAAIIATTITTHAQWHGDCQPKPTTTTIVNRYYYYPTYGGGFDHRAYDARYYSPRDNSKLVLFGIKTFIPMYIFSSPRQTQTYEAQPYTSYRKVIIE